MTPAFPAMRRTLVAILLVIGVTWLVSLLALPWAPASIPVHWGIDGQPDRYASSVVGLLQVPVIMSVLALVLRFIPRIDPQRANYSSFAPTYGYIQLAIMLFLAVLQSAIIAIAFGWLLDMSFVMLVICGALFAALGNVMGKLRPNWFAGVRTPWTLSSPDVWTGTHRISGLLMVLIGIIQIIAAPLLPASARLVLLLVSVSAWAVFAIGYSYWLWRKQHG